MQCVWILLWEYDLRMFRECWGMSENQSLRYVNTSQLDAVNPVFTLVFRQYLEAPLTTNKPNQTND